MMPLVLVVVVLSLHHMRSSHATAQAISVAGVWRSGCAVLTSCTSTEQRVYRTVGQSRPQEQRSCRWDITRRRRLSSSCSSAEKQTGCRKRTCSKRACDAGHGGCASQFGTRGLRFLAGQKTPAAAGSWVGQIREPDQPPDHLIPPFNPDCRP